MPTKFSIILQQVTEADDRESASPHIAGWTESFWFPDIVQSSDATLNTFMQRRAGLLGKQGTVVGFRLAYYTIEGNRLIPSGSSSGKRQYPGSPSVDCDLPQVALQCSADTPDGPNSSRFTLRGIPDNVMVKGEYTPSADFKSRLTRYFSIIEGHAWCFLGRDLSKPSAKILKLNNSVLELAGNIGAVVGSYVRLLKAKHNVTGKNVSGAFRVTAVSGNNLTLENLPEGTQLAAAGTARVDAVKLFNIGTCHPGRAVVRKVGRPFESYRGRQSKR